MKLWKKYKDTPEGTAVLAALIGGILTHHFALVNVMHNIDDIGNQPRGYGVGLSSGRWLLTLLGDGAEFLNTGFNLPYVNGLLFLVLIALSAGFLVSTLRIKERYTAAAIGCLLAVFPPAAVALVYRFTAVYYGIAFLLAVLAAWVLPRGKYSLLISAMLTACSLGIYQAYVSVTIGIFVLLLIRRALEENSTSWDLIRQGCLDCLALILGLAVYFLCLKLCLRLYGTSLSGYNGMSDMGKLSLRDLPGLIWSAFRNFCAFPLTNYCGLSGSKLIKAAYLLLGGESVALIGYLVIFKVRKIDVAIITGLLCLVFPVAVNFVEIMSPQAWIYTMMVYAFVLVPCVPLVLMECLPAGARWQAAVRKCSAALLAVIIFSYGYITNINYTAHYFVNRQVENYVGSIVTQVRMTEGFTPEKKWALIGDIEDPLLASPWEAELTYGGLFASERTLNDISQYYWFWTYVGYRIPEANPETVRLLRDTPEVRAMPCWPSEGSIRIIGEDVVIKFSE